MTRDELIISLSSRHSQLIFTLGLGLNIIFDLLDTGCSFLLSFHNSILSSGYELIIDKTWLVIDGYKSLPNTASN